MSAASLRSARRVSPKQICWVLVVLCLAALFPLQKRIDGDIGIYAKISDVLYIPPGTHLKLLCLGNEGLVADIYWTRVVQYFGREHLEGAGGEFRLLAPLLRITTELDPQLLVAYRFGAIFVMAKQPIGAGDPQAALQLLRRGIVANPNYWQLWQDLGFVYYWELHDYKMAAKIFAVGSNQPGAHYWLKALAGTVAAKGGDFETSRFLWSEIYRNAETEAVRSTAEYHLAALEATEQMGQLNDLLEIYKQKSGHEAHSFSDLIAIRLIRGFPVDPSGVPYVIGADGYTALGQGSQIHLHLLQ